MSENDIKINILKKVITFRINLVQRDLKKLQKNKRIDVN